MMLPRQATVGSQLMASTRSIEGKDESYLSARKLPVGQAHSTRYSAANRERPPDSQTVISPLRLLQFTHLRCLANDGC
jgi:hypothetical protein